MRRTVIPASDKQPSAFTRLELMACLGAIGLFGAVILPELARCASRSDRVVCFNNLRQIGVAYTQFGLEHDDLTPWRVPMHEGGNMNHPLNANVSIQFSVLSNALATPKVLADPGDRRVGLRPANNWGTGSGGLLNAAIGQNGISYFLGLDGHFRMSRAVLAGDRNVIAVSGLGSTVLPSPHSEIQPSSTAWTNDVHGLDGSLLFYDGSVDQVDSPGLRAAFGTRDVTLRSSGYSVLFP